MDRPARVLLFFDKTNDPLWLGLAEGLEQKENVHEVGNLAFVKLQVRSYSLTDHQFVQVKVRVQDLEVLLQIPRRLVMTIVEGAESLGKDFFYFGGGKKK